jgi:hypothetical protein
MRYIKYFESFNKDRILIIVDVQKSFKKFFNDKYLAELNKYCNEFSKVYQVWDNHSDGKHPDKDFLYQENPDIENKDDLYKFNKQKDLIEKRYTYDVDVDYFKDILDENTFNEIKSKGENIKKGEYFNTTEGTIIVYIGNNHRFFHLPKKLYDLFKSIKSEEIVVVGGAKMECIEDIMVSAKALGLNLLKNDRYIYSATSCPIK